jgi:hypothetical protein
MKNVEQDFFFCCSLSSLVTMKNMEQDFVFNVSKSKTGPVCVCKS